MTTPTNPPPFHDPGYGPPVNPPNTPPARRRRSLLTIIGTIAALVIAVLVIGYFVTRHPDKPQTYAGTSGSTPLSSAFSSVPNITAPATSSGPSSSSGSSSGTASASSSPSASPSTSSGATPAGVLTDAQGCVTGAGSLVFTQSGNTHLGLDSEDWPMSGPGQAVIKFAASGKAGYITAEAGTYATIPQIVGWLNDAATAGVKIEFSVRDYWTPAPDATVAGYRAQFGTTPLAQMIGVAKCFYQHPAFGGIKLVDRIPGSPDTVGTWPGKLHQAYTSIKAVSSSIVVNADYDAWTAPDAGTRQHFLATALNPGDGWSDHVGAMYYPWPDSPPNLYGGVGGITTTSKDIKAVDADGRYGIQCFDWWKIDPKFAARFHFSRTGSAPTTANMDSMVAAALAGGVTNVRFDSYTEAYQTGAGQLDQLKQAMLDTATLLP